MANAFGVKVDRSPNRFRAGGLSRVRGEAEAIVGGISVGIAEEFGRGLLLVTADSDGDHVAVAIADGQFKHLLCGLDSEVADGIEDPQ